MSDKMVTLNFRDGKSLKLGLIQGTLGQYVIDARTLRLNNLFVFDPGFTSTASCESKITYIDGNNGILLYRGFPVEELAKNSNYLEVCYILLYGEIPNEQQFNKFKENIYCSEKIQSNIINLFSGFNRKSHPMGIMCSIVAALAAFYFKDTINDENIPNSQQSAAYTLLSIMPILTAMCYRYIKSLPFIHPVKKLSYAGNFLNMMFLFSNKNEEYEIDPILEKALDRILILHADHEQNASTSTVRTVGSSGSNLFACISAGIASLWGSAHGGANEACLRMLKEIGTVKRIPKFIDRAKNKKDSFRLMGFGHRIYKNYDPRAIVMRETCYEVLQKLNLKDDLLEIAVELEHIALKDQYFIERKLYPNVDFYSGLLLRTIGIPIYMFTAVFAMARTVGWITHWKEMCDFGFKISRPRQLYTGYTRRDFKK